MPHLSLALACALLTPAADPPAWAGPMAAVHAKFTGTPGTVALFGDSITNSQAFWSPLAYAPKPTDSATAVALELTKARVKPDCWAKWRGPEYGNQSGQTTAWAAQNVDGWLKKLNPEVAVVLFGTNDLAKLPPAEYEAKLRQVVEKCLKNGTVVVLTTVPPRSGAAEKAKAFADAARKVAADLKVPLVDYHAEVLKRRPDDWDGRLPQFKGFEKDVYAVPTLIAADGVHPSNPGKFKDFSDESLRSNGYLLRTYLTLHAYADVARHALGAK